MFQQDEVLVLIFMQKKGNFPLVYFLAIPSLTLIHFYREVKKIEKMQTTDLPKLFCGIAEGSKDPSTTHQVKETSKT